MKVTKKFYKYIIFALAVALILSPLFIYQKPGNMYTDAFLKSEAKPDVWIMGSSHAYCNLNGTVMWNEYGISAFGLAQAEQPLCMTYYELKSALKTAGSKPQLVVVETYMGLLSDEFNQENMENHFVKAIFPFPYFSTLSIRIEAARRFLPSDKQLDYIFGYPVYHMDYENLWNKEYTYYAGFAFLSKGDSGTYRGTHFTVDDVDKATPIDPASEEYLIKTIELCRMENVELLLLTTPYQTEKEDMQKFKYMEEIAKKHGAAYLDLNDYIDEIGLDIFGNDMVDWGHSSSTGSEKNSLFLGKYIKDNYKVSDRSSDPAYSYWDSAYDNYLAKLAKGESSDG